MLVGGSEEKKRIMSPLPPFMSQISMRMLMNVTYVVKMVQMAKTEDYRWVKLKIIK